MNAKMRARAGDVRCIFEGVGCMLFTSWKEWKSRVSAQKFLTSPEGGDGSVMVDESDGGGEKEGLREVGGVVGVDGERKV